MKEFYRIHELSGLFGLCPDTLRYYEEKGLLHPARGENRYRMYGIQDVITLNIVRSLRELGMTVEDIRTYLERRSVEETLALLEEEERLLRRRMEELERTRRQARRRQARLGAVRRCGSGAGGVFVRGGTFLRLFAGGHHPGGGDRLPAEKAGTPASGLYQDHRGPVHGGGGGRREPETRRVQPLFQGLFPYGTGPAQRRRPACGGVRAPFYRGGYGALQRHFQTLLAQVAAAAAGRAGEPLELYRIDAHDTNREAEYVTELQVPVR